MAGTILLVALFLVFMGSMTNSGKRFVNWVMASYSRRIVSGLIAMAIVILLAFLTRDPPQIL